MAEAVCRHVTHRRRAQALGEELGVLVSFGFDGYSGGEFAFNMGFRPRGT
jgi:hypothetical protein